MLSGESRLHFHETNDDAVIAFSRAAPECDPILVVVTLDPSRPREVALRPDLGALGLDPSTAHPAVELLSGRRAVWCGAPPMLRLDPADEPARIFAIGRSGVRAGAGRG